MFIVYAIKSIEHNYIYVGLTGNLEERLKRHNSGYEKITKPYKAYQLKNTGEYSALINKIDFKENCDNHWWMQI
jgi:predicted GIY-YIG superfamily endonuclease